MEFHSDKRCLEERDGGRHSITHTRISAQGPRRLMRFLMMTGIQIGSSGPMELEDFIVIFGLSAYLD